MNIEVKTNDWVLPNRVGYNKKMYDIFHPSKYHKKTTAATAKAAKASKASKKENKKQEEEQEEDVVKKIEYNGSKYFKSKKTGIIYDYNKLKSEGEQVKLGIWNEATNKIDFDEDSDSDEESEDEYEE